MLVSALLAVAACTAASPQQGGTAGSVSGSMSGTASVGSASIQGTVTDSSHQPVVDAKVVAAAKGRTGVITTTSRADGSFIFAALPSGTYHLTSEKSGLHSRPVDEVVLPGGEQRHVELVLDVAGTGQKQTQSAAQEMQFTDQPNFTVAGVTDWTAAGGHGSDARLRTSEDLTRETVVLKPSGGDRSASGSKEAATDARTESELRAAVGAAPRSFEANHRLGEFCLREKDFREAISSLQAAYEIDPANSINEHELALAYQGTGDFRAAREHVQHLLAHKDDAEMHRMLGELDEELGDSLQAVREDERAVEIDPSEENYFQWGSELLLHRAVEPAIDVFGKSVKAYPKSARALEALGAALFAAGRNDEAAQRVCEASDLNPADATPYVFLGKIDMAAPEPVACVEPKLAGFVRQQPDNALANYYYAMAIRKAGQSAQSNAALQPVETLLLKAVSDEPSFDEALLQLGILYATEGNFAKAAAFDERAIAANPKLSEAHYRLGMAYARLGQQEKSKEQFALYNDLKKEQAAEIERQRKEIKQFLIVLKDKSPGAATN